MKISASIYSNPNKSLADIVRELDSYHVDYLHVDCNDDLRIFEDIREIRKISKTPIDLHIITPDPQKYYQQIFDNKIEYVCFQYENIKSELEVPAYIDSKLGIAVVNDTDVSIFDRFFQNGFSFGLLMTTTPGQSGGAFNNNTYGKIAEFKKLYPSKSLHVDGGVTDAVAGELRGLGVDCSISGSYLLRSEDVGIALSKLKSNIDNLNFRVEDFMLRVNELPVLQDRDLNLANVLEIISRYKMAFCLIVDDAKKLVGVITDGDIRRQMLDNIHDLNRLTANDMMNFDPIIIEHDKFIKDAFDLIKKYQKKIMFLPVVDSDKKLKGVISINQLIKGSL